jgi:hypothetical protein
MVSGGLAHHQRDDLLHVKVSAKINRNTYLRIQSARFSNVVTASSAKVYGLFQPSLFNPLFHSLLCFNCYISLTTTLTHFLCRVFHLEPHLAPAVAGGVSTLRAGAIFIALFLFHSPFLRPASP